MHRGMVIGGQERWDARGIGWWATVTSFAYGQQALIEGQGCFVSMSVTNGYTACSVTGILYKIDYTMDHFFKQR